MDKQEKIDFEKQSLSSGLQNRQLSTASTHPIGKICWVKQRAKTYKLKEGFFKSEKTTFK